MDDKLPEVDRDAVLGPAADVAWVAVADEVVVYRAADAASLVLDPIAGLLWQCLDRSSRLGDILDDLADVFRADRAQVEEDCIPVLRTWLAESLVEEVRSG